MSNLKIGQIVYGTNYKTKRISFDKDLFIGLKLMKPKIRNVGERFITLEFDKYNTQKISKDKVGKVIFTTEERAVNHIIKELKNRIKELENRKRNMPFDIECEKGLKTNLKKWQKFALLEKQEIHPTKQTVQTESGDELRRNPKRSGGSTEAKTGETYGCGKDMPTGLPPRIWDCTKPCGSGGYLCKECSETKPKTNRSKNDT